MTIATSKKNPSQNHAFSIVAIKLGDVYSIGTIMSFQLGLYSIEATNHAFSIGAMFKHWT